MFFDPWYFLIVGPAMLLGVWAQFRVRSTFHEAQQVRASMSGAAAARHILDVAGLQDIAIEQVPGELSDHYDPREKVLRLSQSTYGASSLAAVGIAAHEAGHALQDAGHYAPLVIRNAAVPMAGFGSSGGMILFILGMIVGAKPLVLLGIGLFACVVFFQVINLPVEFDASNRAKALLVEHNIVPQREMVYVNKVLNAAALTYVAATLQAILTLLYLIMRSQGRD
jgi:hypothetical protein